MLDGKRRWLGLQDSADTNQICWTDGGMTTSRTNKRHQSGVLTLSEGVHRLKYSFDSTQFKDVSVYCEATRFACGFEEEFGTRGCTTMNGERERDPMIV